MKVLAFGLCLGAGVQAWRNFPGDGPETIGPAMLVMFVAVLFAFAGGYTMGRPSARASAAAFAAARSESSSTAASAATVNVAVVVPGQGAGASGTGALFPSADASWLGVGRESVSIDDVDGMDMSELMDVREGETS